MHELKKILTHERQLNIFFNKNFNIEELDNLILRLTKLNNQRKEAIEKQMANEKAIQDLADKLTMDLEKYNIKTHELIHFLRNN